eukprot:superscaffoldBa00000763_g7074
MKYVQGPMTTEIIAPAQTMDSLCPLSPPLRSSSTQVWSGSCLDRWHCVIESAAEAGEASAQCLPAPFTWVSPGKQLTGTQTANQMMDPTRRIRRDRGSPAHVALLQSEWLFPLFLTCALCLPIPAQPWLTL